MQWENEGAPDELYHSRTGCPVDRCLRASSPLSAPAAEKKESRKVVRHSRSDVRDGERRVAQVIAPSAHRSFSYPQEACRMRSLGGMP